MTTKIRIPSSEGPPPLMATNARNRSGPLLGGALAVVVATILAAIAVVSNEGAAPLDDGEVPAPFPIEDLTVDNTDSGLASSVPTLVKLRGAGTVVAAGSVGETAVAVSTDAGAVLVWTLIDIEWTYTGQIDVDSVDSVQVSDNRVLVVGSDGGTPYVWEWIDGQLRALFQPPVGWITGAWSVGGQLVVATSVEAFPSPGDAIRFGRRDELWLEDPNGQFTSIDLSDMTTVLTVNGANGVIAVGGSDDGQPRFGFLHDNSLIAEEVPSDATHAGVTDIQLDFPDAYALVSVFDDRSVLTDTQIRGAGRAWDTLADAELMTAIDTVANRLVALDVDGRLIDVNAGVLVGGSQFRVRDGSVAGFTVIAGEPLVFGEVDGQPAMAMWGDAALRVSLPRGSWQRYHSQVSDGYHVIGVGSRDFALRSTHLFERAWNADRWHRAEFDGEVSFFGPPRIVETDWGFVLAPLVGSDLYRSSDGSRWERVETPLGRTGHLVTDGLTVIAMSSVNSPVDINAGPTTELVVLTETGIAVPGSIQMATIAPGWAEGVGFYASVAPGRARGYVTSDDGLVWTHVTEGAQYDLVTAVDQQFYWWSGEAATAGGAPIDLPGDAIGLVVRGQGVVLAAGASGSNWVRFDGEWVPIGFGVSDGLPGRPVDMVIRNGVLFAFVEAGISSEVWMFELE